jgi:hypothetical protein
MKKEKKPMEWADFTNKILGTAGKFVMLPLVVIGALLTLSGEVIGIAVRCGGCFLFVLLALTLVILKPILIKKYPEKRKDRYMADPAAPYEALSPIQKLAVDQFNGNIEEACAYVLDNMDKAAQIEYTENLTQDEAMAFFRVMNRQMESKYTKKEIKKLVDLEYALSYLHMTEEEILTAQKNPFTPKLWRRVGILLAIAVGIGVITGLGERFWWDSSVVGTVDMILGCAMTFYVWRVVEAIRQCSQFKKAKRALQKETVQ